MAVTSPRELDEEHSHTSDFTQRTWKDDVTFVVEDKHLYASKSVLALVSPVFETMFSSSFKEKEQDEIALPDKKYDDFLEFLCYTYPLSSRDITKENVYRLLPLAEEYNVITLKRRCVEFLAGGISDFSRKDILQTFVMSSQYNVDSLREECVEELIQSGAPLSLNDEDLHDMDKGILVQYLNDVVSQFRKKDTEKQTAYVKKLVCLSPNLENLKVDLPGYEHATGVTLEHPFASVVDLPWNEPQYSRLISVWNLKFRIKTYICEDHLAFFLQCVFPEENEEAWKCSVKAIFCIDVLVGKANKCYKTVYSYGNNHDFTDSSKGWGFKKCIKMSTLLNEGEGLSAKLVVHLLVNEPTKSEIQEKNK